MSWFEYGSLPPKKRRLRKGVWLRASALPGPIVKAARRCMRSKHEEIDWVVVSEMRDDGEVLLEFWCHVPGKADVISNGNVRYTVFHLLAKEDPSWICEGDMGRGFRE